MKQNLIIIVALMAFFITTLAIIYQSYYPKNYCCEKLPETENCKVVDVPREKKINGLQPEDVMLYYRVDDNCNFQTLNINGYVHTLKDSTVNIEKRPYTILGRFTGQYLPNNQYKIKRLEAKIFELVLPPSRPKKQYKIDRISIASGSTPDKFSFKIHIKEDDEYTNIKEVDYIYGLREGEDAIVLNANAKIGFDSVMVDGGRPSGEYECNGKVIFGRSN